MKELNEVIYNNYKSFNELIERLESVKDAIKKHNYGIAMDILCKSYPEFKITTSIELEESEDEKIMKEIAEFIYNSAFRPKDINKKEKWLTWFEKQGEQKPAIIIQKFRVGDEIKINNEESLTITKIDEKGYWSDDLFICSFEDSAKWELVEQKPVWSEEDERLLSKLQTYVDLECFDRECNGQDLIDWLKSLKDRVQPQPKQEWSEKYIADVFEKVGLAKIAREQGYDALTEAIQSAMIELSKFTPQPKQEWSEEDKQYFNFLEKLLENLQVKSTENEIKKGINSNSEYYYKVIQWLKSLRLQKHWKPSEKQINALIDVLSIRDIKYDVLSELLECLKKLK